MSHTNNKEVLEALRAKLETSHTHNGITFTYSVPIDVDTICEFLRQQLQKAREDWLEEQITALEFEKLPYPYVCKSPFPSEGVDFHLKTYGHLPDFRCCKYDQLTREETDVYNNALQTIIDRFHSELDQPSITNVSASSGMGAGTSDTVTSLHDVPYTLTTPS